MLATLTPSYKFPSFQLSLHHSESATLQVHGVVERLKKESLLQNTTAICKKVSHRHNYHTYILNKKAVAESMPNHIKKKGKNKKDTVYLPS